MQKAIIVRDDETELNRLLEKGWRVTQTCPMPSSRSAWGAGGSFQTHQDYRTPPTCLVVLDRLD